LTILHLENLSFHSHIMLLLLCFVDHTGNIPSLSLVFNLPQLPVSYLVL
jgi:hypothetical protein